MIDDVTGSNSKDASSSGHPCPGHDKTILIVEDDEMNRKLYRRILAGTACRLIEATTGRMGIELAKTHRPDLILMDVRLPDISGLAAVAEIRRCPDTRDIPLLAVTAFAMEEDRAEALRAGCSGFITKPLNLNAFVQEVRGLLGNPPAPGEGR